jgi:hypothetical protein
VLIAVLRYMVEHPDAKDTMEGIIEWWSPAAGACRSERDVRAAVEFLLEKSWITVRNVGDTGKLYGVWREQLPEMRAFLADLEKRREPDEKE